MRCAPLLTILVLAAPAAAAAPSHAFDPIAFFTGHTEGTGDLRVILHGPRTLSVHGDGTVDPDGTLVLDQTVERPGKPDRTREWRICRAGPGRYTGTLSDATGPVTGTTSGDRLHLTYRMKGSLGVDQWLTLAPDGRSAHNVMRIRLHGIVVARLDETIRREGG